MRLIKRSTRYTTAHNFFAHNSRIAIYVSDRHCPQHCGQWAKLWAFLRMTYKTIHETTLKRLFGFHTKQRPRHIDRRRIDFGVIRGELLKAIAPPLTRLYDRLKQRLGIDSLDPLFAV